MYRITLCAAALMSCLSLFSVAVAASAPKAYVSAPSNGTNAEPSAAVRKQAVETQMEGSKVFYKPKVLPFGMWGAASQRVRRALKEHAAPSQADRISSMTIGE